MADAITPATSQYAEAGPFKIHYTAYGPESAPALILLHGGGPGANGWSNYNRNIAGLSARHRVYVLDFPGWGKSSKNLNAGPHPSPFRNGGAAVIAFMDALGIPKAHIVGNSFGGSSALYAALDNPDRVDRLVLMGPGGADLPGPPTPGVLQLLTYFGGEGPTKEKLRAFLVNLVYDQSVLTDDFVEARFQASLDPEIAANPPLRLPPGPPPKASILSNDPRLAELKHKVLFIWGLEDKVNPPEGVHTFRAIPHHDIVLLSNIGHWAQWEDAPKFNELTLWHLERA